MEPMEITLQPFDILALRHFAEHISSCKGCRKITQASGAFRMCAGGSWIAGKVFRVISRIPGLVSSNPAEQVTLW